MRLIRIFVSSPGDALLERKRVGRVAERLNATFSGHCAIELIRWEEHFYTAHESFQPQIARASKCDIVLGILRSRLGSPLSEEFHNKLPPEEQLPDGERYPSGTAYEILSAIRARQCNKDGDLPDVYVFRWANPPQITLGSTERAEIEAQWEKLQTFVKDVFFTSEGQFKGAYQTYDAIDLLEQQVENLVTQWIEKRVLNSRSILWPTDTKHSPFRGLEPFGSKHAEVFFGRDRDRCRVFERIKTAAEGGLPVQLIIGPSGAGKSSFARAGLAPMLTKPGAVSGVGTWRMVLMHPGESSDGPVCALAQRLFDDASDIPDHELGRPIALPELRSSDYATPQALGALLQRADEVSIVPILATLARVAESDRCAWGAEHKQPARLLLLVDQLDEVFSPSVSVDSREKFAKLLLTLAQTGQVWLIATLRAEFYEVFLKSSLAQLVDSEHTYTLQPPGMPELAEIIRGPARASGIMFDVDPASGECLDERLLRDIDRPDLLPLLQFVLEKLYEQREFTQDLTSISLTFAAYERLGTLDGAINTAAVAAVAELGPAEQAGLPRLLRTLVASAAGMGKNAPPILRKVSLAKVASDGAALRLVTALINARILITRRGEHGEALISLAHQRVIEAWPEARRIIEESQNFYRVIQDVIDERRRWELGGRRKELLIPRGLPLAEAERVAFNYPEEVSILNTLFIRKSRKHANRVTSFAIALTVVFGIFALFAGVAGAMAVWKRDEAQEKGNQALITQSRFLADQANQLTNLPRNDAVSAMLLALEALPDLSTDRVRPYAPEAELALLKAHQHLQETLVFKGHTQGVMSGAFSPDGQRVVTASYDRTARIWDAQSGQLLISLQGHGGAVMSATFSPDGQRVLTASYDRTARIWDAQSGKQIGLLQGHADGLTQASFSPDGQRILTASRDKIARIWDAQSGQLLMSLQGHGGAVMSAAFSPDGQRVVTASYDGVALVWDAQSGQLLLPLQGHTGAVVSAVFSPDSRQVLTASYDNTARIWEAKSGQQLGVLSGHTDDVASAVFSPDGQRILTASYDNTARVWLVTATTQAVVDYVKFQIPRCLTPDQRRKAFLDESPPEWCIQNRKWPYHTQDWRRWLKQKHDNKQTPYPNTPEWDAWLSSDSLTSSHEISQ